MFDDQFLQRECAAALTRAIVDIFRSVLRPEEFQDALDEVYATVRAALLCYEHRRDNVYPRLEPMNN